ncbi:recombinase family protein [Brevundimonas diminuta]|uniref:recombinase family protein n=1 Tax=Brevundimonas diminuta TaxID=293 RepID=UPI001F5837A1|nr:recombinase family protein [Brevundimonas diminuta]
MAKAVAYFRVSTAAQGRSGLGLEAQKAAVAELTRQRGLQVLADFTEVESGGRNDRPELTKALHHAKVTGAVLVIAKLDRLSRNAAFLLTLRDSGVRFVAADLPDACDLTVGVLAVIAQAEREAISQRTKAALGTVKAKLVAGEAHISRRTGLPVARLGNPQGAEALRRAARGNAAGLEAVKANADAHARDLAPIVARLREEGCTSLASLAAGLNAAGVRTPRDGTWHASSVRNLLARMNPSA